MSLLINGINMPRCCKECGLLIDEDFSCDSSPHYCAVNQYLRWRDWSEVPEYILAGCPLIEIPTPHGRLIDADRLIAVLKSTTAISQSDYNLFNHIVGLIEHQPTVIEKEKE